MCQEKAAPVWEGAWLHNRTVRARGHGAEGLCSLELGLGTAGGNRCGRALGEMNIGTKLGRERQEGSA